MKIRDRIKAKETRFKIRKSYLGWLFIAVSIALMVAGVVYYIQAFSGESRNYPGLEPTTGNFSIEIEGY